VLVLFDDVQDQHASRLLERNLQGCSRRSEPTYPDACLGHV
jgi:hypothetical protein